MNTNVSQGIRPLRANKTGFNLTKSLYCYGCFVLVSIDHEFKYTNLNHDKLNFINELCKNYCKNKTLQMDL